MTTWEEAEAKGYTEVWKCGGLSIHRTIAIIGEGHEYQATPTWYVQVADEWGGVRTALSISLETFEDNIDLDPDSLCQASDRPARLAQKKVIEQALASLESGSECTYAPKLICTHELTGFKVSIDHDNDTTDIVTVVASPQTWRKSTITSCFYSSELGKQLLLDMAKTLELGWARSAE